MTKKKIISTVLSLLFAGLLFAQTEGAAQVEVKENTGEGNKLALPEKAEKIDDGTLTLHQQLMQQVDVQNNELKNLREEYAQALVDVKNAKAGIGPTLDLTVSATYMTNPMIDA
nr:TolC family protein [Treponemataceae bacterium]